MLLIGWTRLSRPLVYTAGGRCPRFVTQVPGSYAQAAAPACVPRLPRQRQSQRMLS